MFLMSEVPVYKPRASRSLLSAIYLLKRISCLLRAGVDWRCSQLILTGYFCIFRCPDSPDTHILCRAETQLQRTGRSRHSTPATVRFDPGPKCRCEIRGWDSSSNNNRHDEARLLTETLISKLSRQEAHGIAHPLWGRHVFSCMGKNDHAINNQQRAAAGICVGILQGVPRLPICCPGYSDRVLERVFLLERFHIQGHPRGGGGASCEVIQCSIQHGRHIFFAQMNPSPSTLQLFKKNPPFMNKKMHISLEQMHLLSNEGPPVFSLSKATCVYKLHGCVSLPTNRTLRSNCVFLGKKTAETAFQDVRPFRNTAMLDHLTRNGPPSQVHL